MECEICKKEIKKKDNYCRITDYKEGEFLIEKFYHTQCYNDRLRGKMEKGKMALMAMVGNLVGRADKQLRRIESE